MADIDLPVLPFRLDWKEGVVERLSFLTTLLKGEEGAEQRFSRRLTPRRGVDVDFVLSGPERTFYDLFIHKHGGGEMMVPLYWDVGITPAILTVGVTDRINFDTRWTDFAPGLAIIQGKVATSFEVIEIVAVDDDGIDLADPVTYTWPKGTRVMPLRRAILDDMGSLSHHTAGVAQVSAQISYSIANYWNLEAEELTEYDGLPVFQQEPNWVDVLDVGLERDLVKLDNDTGLPYQVDPTGRASVGQAHRWLLRNREQQALLRSFLYAQQGRRGTFWLPTFKADLSLSSTALSASTQLVVKNAGLVYTAIPTSGRDRLAIFPRGTTPLFREITSTANGPNAATERVNLDLAVGLDLSPGLARKISFLDTAHFDQDEFEIEHLTSHVAEMTAGFRTFKNSRDPDGPIYYPIPEAEMTEDPCGDPGPCYIPGPPTWLFKLEFLGGPNGGRIGEPGLGFWCTPENNCHGQPGPAEFSCYNYAIFPYIDHSPEADPGSCIDDFTEPQHIQIRIQGGTGTAGCPSVGDRLENVRVSVKGPDWPDYRPCPPRSSGLGGIGDATYEGGGVFLFQSSGFPGTFYAYMYPTYDDEGWG